MFYLEDILIYRLLPLLIFLAVVFYGVVLGKKIFRWLPKIKTSKLETFLFSLALGWGLIAFGVYFLGLAGILYRSIIAGLVLISLFWVRLELKNIFLILRQWSVKKFLQSTVQSPFEFVLVSLFLILVLLNLIGTLAPEIKFDSTWYHLPEAKYYLDHHHIVWIKGQMDMVSMMPRLMEMLYTFVLSIAREDVLAKLVHFGMGMFAALTAFSLARRFLDRRSGLLAGILLYSCAVITWLSQTAYIDMGSFFFGGLAIYAFSVWFLEKDAKWLPWAGLFLALTISVKTWNLILLPIMLVILLIYARPRKIIWKFVAPVLLGLTFYLEAWWRTGNPIYPVFSIPDSIHLPGEHPVSNWFFHLYPRVFLKNISYLLLRETLFPFILLPLFFLRPLPKPIKFFLILGVSYFLLWSFIPNQEERYALIGFFPLALVAGWGFSRLLKSQLIVKIFTITVLILTLSMQIMLSFKQNIRDEKYFPVVTGRETVRQYLSNTMGPNIWTFYDLDSYFQNNLQKSDKILIFAHNYNYVNFNYLDAYSIENELEEVKSEEELLKLFKKYQLTHILFKTTSFPESSLFNLLPEEISQDRVWIGEHLKLIYINNYSGVSFYKIDY